MTNINKLLKNISQESTLPELYNNKFIKIGSWNMEIKILGASKETYNTVWGEGWYQSRIRYIKEN